MANTKKDYLSLKIRVIRTAADVVRTSDSYAVDCYSGEDGGEYKDENIWNK